MPNMRKSKTRRGWPLKAHWRPQLSQSKAPSMAFGGYYRTIQTGAARMSVQSCIV